MFVEKNLKIQEKNFFFNPRHDSIVVYLHLDNKQGRNVNTNQIKKNALI